MAKNTGNISKLRVGEIGTKIITLRNGKKRVVTMKRIASKGFPQFIILNNEKCGR